MLLLLMLLIDKIATVFKCFLLIMRRRRRVIMMRMVVATWPSRKIPLVEETMMPRRMRILATYVSKNGQAATSSI